MGTSEHTGNAGQLHDVYDSALNKPESRSLAVRFMTRTEKSVSTGRHPAEISRLIAGRLRQAAGFLHRE